MTDRVHPSQIQHFPIVSLQPTKNKRIVRKIQNKMTLAYNKNTED